MFVSKKETDPAIFDSNILLDEIGEENRVGCQIFML